MFELLWSAPPRSDTAATQVAAGAEVVPDAAAAVLAPASLPLAAAAAAADLSTAGVKRTREQAGIADDDGAEPT